MATWLEKDMREAVITHEHSPILPERGSSFPVLLKVSGAGRLALDNWCRWKKHFTTAAGAPGTFALPCDGVRLMPPMEVPWVASPHRHTALEGHLGLQQTSHEEKITNINKMKVNTQTNKFSMASQLRFWGYCYQSRSPAVLV